MSRIPVASRAALVLALATMIAGCASQPPQTSATAAPTPAPSALPLVTSAPPSQSATPASPGASPAGGVVEDPALIAVLPEAVDGVKVNLEHQAFVDAATDAAFAEHVARAAFGVAVDGGDLVSGVVAELQPDRFNDAFFRDWRDSYNDGACGQSGGVIGNAEAEIAGRTVYIASCAGGLRTYHAWLPERGAIVSAFALGERHLGETLMEGLRP